MHENKSDEKIIEEIGTRAHDMLVQHRGGGAYVKTTKDEMWAQKHGTYEVDLAVCTYAELPTDWKDERDAGARIALNVVRDAHQCNTPLDEDFIEKIAAVLHDAWLERNARRANDEQRLTYEGMSENEKEKDRIFVRAAIEVVS